MQLTNTFALVTGASTGIGRAISLELGKEGATVGLIGRSKEKLQETQSLITKYDGKAEIFQSDLSDLESIQHLITAIKQKTKTINILVNVAGIWHGADEVYADRDFDTFPVKVILDTYTVGLTAPTLLSHACIPLMSKNSKVINISGTFENGAKGWLPYFVSKRAIEDLTIGLAEEVKDKSIQVNAISPSDTATEAYAKYFPQYMDEAIDPSEIAKQALYLCSADEITGKVFVMKKGVKPYEGYHS